MNKWIAFLGALSISLTVGLSAHAGTAVLVGPEASQKALSVLIKHARSVKLVGDTAADTTLSDILASVIVGADSLEIRNMCSLGSQGSKQVLSCRLEANHEIAETVLDYEVLVKTDDGKSIDVIKLNTRTVRVTRGI